MASQLVHAVERLRISQENSTTELENIIDNKLQEYRARKKQHRSPAEMKAVLEEEFLSPPTAFGPEWLNKFQQYVVRHSFLILLTIVLGAGTLL